MLLKEQFRRFNNNHVGQKKVSKDQPSKSSPALLSSSASSSTPRSSLSTSSSPVPSSLKKQIKGAMNNLQLNNNNSDPSYTYDSRGTFVDRVPSNYLHQLKKELVQPEPGIYQLSTPQLNKVLESWFSNPLPNSSKLFPYLHGAVSQTQCDFLEMNEDDDLPSVRYLLIIKSNEVDNFTMIKSTITPDDIYVEPLNGVNSSVINLRNYSSQITLLSNISDFIIYSEDNNFEDNITLAHELLQLQKSNTSRSSTKRHYNTYILDYDSNALSAKYKINQDLSRLSPSSALHFTMNNWNMNYLFHERVEMWLMTSKSEIHKNLYLGNVNDLHPENTHGDEFSLVINCRDGVRIPSAAVMDQLLQLGVAEADRGNDDGTNPTISLSFASAGSYSVETMSNLEVESAVKMCKLIYHYTEVLNKKVFIYCFDGYSAYSFLCLAYEMYKTGVCLTQAIITYFVKYERPLYFFKNDYDVLLQCLQKQLVQDSPKLKTIQEVDVDDTTSLTSSINSMKLSAAGDSDIQALEKWLTNSNDKNPPARIFPHLYLGTFEHASCSILLKKLHVTQVISFGQIPTWMNELDMDHLRFDKHYSLPDMDESSAIYVYHNPTPKIKRLIHVPYLEDDGKCSIINYFEKIYRLVKAGEILPLNNETNLVHCRVGVSRSASFCILETMKLLNVSLARAYLYVRVRRLNIIIQPNLKIFYELLKIEQCLNNEREIDWHILCREIDYLNRRYIQTI